MKKLLSLFIVSLLFVGSIPFIHIHDDKCGYDPQTKTGCQYENPINPLQDERPND